MRATWGTRVLILVGVASLGIGFAGGALLGPVWRSGAVTARTVAEAPPVALDRDRSGPAADDDGARAAERARLAVAAGALTQVPQLRPSPQALAEAQAQAAHAQAHRRHKLAPHEVPEPVMKVLQQLTLGREMKNTEIERRQRDGRTFYQADFDLEGVEHEYALDEQGKVLYSEWDVAISELPASISGGIQAAVPGAVVLSAEREQRDGDPAVYEIEVNVNGQRRELEMGEDGKVLKQQVR
jgi:uncharacterized membrane protein YkoI